MLSDHDICSDLFINQIFCLFRQRVYEKYPDALEKIEYNRTYDQKILERNRQIGQLQREIADHDQSLEDYSLLEKLLSYGGDTMPVENYAQNAVNKLSSQITDIRNDIDRLELEHRQARNRVGAYDLWDFTTLEEFFTEIDDPNFDESRVLDIYPRIQVPEIKLALATILLSGGTVFKLADMNAVTVACKNLQEALNKELKNGLEGHERDCARSLMLIAGMFAMVALYISEKGRGSLAQSAYDECIRNIKTSGQVADLDIGYQGSLLEDLKEILSGPSHSYSPAFIRCFRFLIDSQVISNSLLAKEYRAQAMIDYLEDLKKVGSETESLRRYGAVYYADLVYGNTYGNLLSYPGLWQGPIRNFDSYKKVLKDYAGNIPGILQSQDFQGIDRYVGTWIAIALTFRMNHTPIKQEVYEDFLSDWREMDDQECLRWESHLRYQIAWDVTKRNYEDHNILADLMGDVKITEESMSNSSFEKDYDRDYLERTYRNLTGNNFSTRLKQTRKMQARQKQTNQKAVSQKPKQVKLGRRKRGTVYGKLIVAILAGEIILQYLLMNGLI